MSMFAADAFRKYPCVNGASCKVPQCVFGHGQDQSNTQIIDSTVEDKATTNPFATTQHPQDSTNETPSLKAYDITNDSTHERSDVTKVGETSIRKRKPEDDIVDDDDDSNDDNGSTALKNVPNAAYGGLTGRQLAKMKRKQRKLTELADEQQKQAASSQKNVTIQETVVVEKKHDSVPASTAIDEMSGTQITPPLRTNATNRSLEGASAYDLTKPPKIKPSAVLKHAWKPRQNAVVKFFQQFQRIYKTISDKTVRFQLSVYHSYLQEEWACENSAPHTYVNKVMEVLSALKKRKHAESSRDTGIYPHYKVADTSKPLIISSMDISAILSTEDGLRLMEYPMFSPKQEQKDITEEHTDNQEKQVISKQENDTNDSGQLNDVSAEDLINNRNVVLESLKKGKPVSLPETICERCSVKFTPTFPLSEAAKSQCIFHHGRYHKKNETWICCNNSLENRGCERRPHVQKGPTPMFEASYPLEWLVNGDESSSIILNSNEELTQPLMDLLETKKKEIPSPPLLVLDCEMGYTLEGLSLMRVTLTTQDNKLFLDSLVIPDMPVIDFNTRFSGLTTLENGIPFSSLRKFLKLLFKDVPDLVLAGHSLENDLRVLRFGHKRIVDTVHLFPHRNGLPFRLSLRHLARYYLGKNIQNGFGHDSKEDCFATCDVIKLAVEDKRKKGPKSEMLTV